MTTSPSSPHPSPQDLSKTLHLHGPPRSSSHPSLSFNGLSKSSQTEYQAKSSSHPSIFNGHSQASQSDSEGNCSSHPQRHHWLCLSQPRCPVSRHLLLSPTTLSSPALLNHPRAAGNQTVLADSTAVDCGRMGSNHETPSTSPHPSNQNGHAAAAKKAGTEVSSTENDNTSSQSPSRNTSSPGRNPKTPTRVQTQGQTSSSKNAHKSGLCMLS
ncbi:hypothetical protein ACOMHN_035991 [Nucella lapillus]